MTIESLRRKPEQGVRCAFCNEDHGVTGIPCRLRHEATPGVIEFAPQLDDRLWEEAPPWAVGLGKVGKSERAVWFSETHYQYMDDPLQYQFTLDVRTIFTEVARR